MENETRGRWKKCLVASNRRRWIWLAARERSGFTTGYLDRCYRSSNCGGKASKQLIQFGSVWIYGDAPVTDRTGVDSAASGQYGKKPRVAVVADQTRAEKGDNHLGNPIPVKKIAPLLIFSGTVKSVLLLDGAFV